MIFESVQCAHIALSNMNQGLRKSICHKSDQQMEEKNYRSLYKYYLKTESIEETFRSMVKLNLTRDSEFNGDHDLNQYVTSNIDSSILANLPDEIVFQNAVELTISDKEAPISSKEDRKNYAKRKFNDISNVNLIEQAINIDTDEDNDDLLDPSISFGSSNLIFDEN
jgi:hypothetical protein